MIEIPECNVLSSQLAATIVGKTIHDVTANGSPHKFAWYTGDPGEYGEKLNGKVVTGSNPGTGYSCGGNTEIICGDMFLVVTTPIKYHTQDAKLPAKHQLLVNFTDGTHISCAVQMWGAMLLLPIDGAEFPDGFTVNNQPSPLDGRFDEAYFDALLSATPDKLSVKAFLATEQRIPGLGNGVLQDILLSAGIHPKRKLSSLADFEREAMFRSVKHTLREMTDQGGRDTEKDLFGNFGGYRTFLSVKAAKSPCRICGDTIIREAYLGGNIYFCPSCQPK